jgi:hypothetical protein
MDFSVRPAATGAPQPVKRSTAKEMKQHAEKLPYPAKQADMQLQPQMSFSTYRAAAKLQDKIALITGADSGIGPGGGGGLCHGKRPRSRALQRKHCGCRRN